MDLSTLITNINGKDFAKAQVIFDDMMNAKVTDALDKEKIKMAGQVFNGEEPPEDEDLTGGDFRFTNHEGSAGVLVGRGGIYLGVFPEAEIAVGEVTEGALVTVGEAGEGTEEPP